MIARALLGAGLAVALAGCVSTVGKVVTAPVKAGSKAADWMTTSQDEADRNRGREIRRQEEAARKACRKEGRRDCGED